MHQSSVFQIYDEEKDLQKSNNNNCLLYTSLSIAVITFFSLIIFVLIYFFKIKPFEKEKNNRIEELEKKVNSLLSSSFNYKNEIIENVTDSINKINKESRLQNDKISEKFVKLSEDSEKYKNFTQNSIYEIVKNNKYMNTSLYKDIKDLREENQNQKKSIDNNFEQLNNNFIDKIGQIDIKIQAIENNYSKDKIMETIINKVYPPLFCVFTLGGLNPQKSLGGDWMQVFCESLTYKDVNIKVLSDYFDSVSSPSSSNNYFPNPFTSQKGLCLWMKVLN